MEIREQPSGSVLSTLWIWVIELRLSGFMWQVLLATEPSFWPMPLAVDTEPQMDHLDLNVLASEDGLE